MYGYSPFKRKLSSASKPSSPPALTIPPRPVFSSTISESPLPTTFDASFQSPHTPPTARDPLMPLSEDSAPIAFESAGSRAPLLHQLSSGSTSPEEYRDDTSSVNFLDNESDRRRPLVPMPAKQTTAPLRMPPPGVHDPYVSRFLTPLDGDGPSPNVRPAPLMRSSSMPGVPQTGLAASLLPQSPIGAENEDVDGKLIFEVFDAQFDVGADNMAKILKGHLAEVLKMQEEVGKMHLGLEGLRAPPAEKADPGVELDNDEQALQKREAGVEAIMERLGALSDELRKYHSLGTPKLSFPKHGSREHDTPQHQRSQSVDVQSTPPLKRSPTSSKTSPEREKSLPRAHSNLDKLTAGLNIDLPDSLRDKYPDYALSQSPPSSPRGRERTTSPKSAGPTGNLAQQATKRSLAQAWDKDMRDTKDAAETEWVEQMRKDLDKSPKQSKK